MRTLIVLLSCILWLACSEEKKKIAGAADSVGTDNALKVAKKESIAVIVNEADRVNESFIEAHKKRLAALDSIIYPIDEKLAFGSSVLTDYRFPENGFAYRMDGPNPNAMDQEQFYKLVEFYTQLKTIHPDEEQIPALVFSELSYLKLAEEDFLKVSDLSRVNSINHFTQRLGNIGVYELYFYIKETAFEGCELDFRNINIENCCYGFERCEEKGFLFLYERKTKKAIVLNPYYIRPEDEGTSFRFFHISENNSIVIYEAYSDVDDYEETKINNQINQTHQITIKEDGNINVNTIYLEELGQDSEEEFTAEELQEMQEIKKQQEQQFISYRDSILQLTEPITVAYSFGAKMLTTHQFPNKEFENVELQHYNALYSIWDYYLKKNQANNKLSFLPFISKYKKIELKGINQWSTLSSLQELDLSDQFNKPRFHFKLPNISKYEVYYATTIEEESSCEISKGNIPIVPCTDCNINGLLFLYDKITQEAYVINVYFTMASFRKTSFRFFYISDDHQIHIYEGQGTHDFQNFEGYDFDEEGNEGYFNPKGRYQLQHKNTIQIAEDGAIKVN